VLVRRTDRTFQGIVTVADLSLQFRSLSEPFLLLGQIENLLRVLVARSFSIDSIRGAKNPTDSGRSINDASDLTFGEYVRLLEPADAWHRLNVSVARDPFLRELRAVQDIRNDVMHFDPDPLGDAEITLLRGRGPGSPNLRSGAAGQILRCRWPPAAASDVIGESCAAFNPAAPPGQVYRNVTVRW